MPDAKLIVLLVQRSWQAVSGTVTIMLVAHFLTPEMQGWYYSFLSLAALYTLFDLGLSVILVQMSARMFVDLQWMPRGEVLGAYADRFKSFAAQSLRHYMVLTIAFAGLVIPAGILFFANRPIGGEGTASWFWPWMTLGISTAVVILTIPVIALIEGSGEIVESYALRVVQGVAGSITCWIVLVSGGQLWATAMGPAMAFVVFALWLSFRRPAMLSMINRTDAAHAPVGWLENIWPLQWRVGLTWLSAYLVTQLLTPILFHYQGAIAAGQMGLSLTIANILGLFAQSWIVRHLPTMAQAAFRKDKNTLDRLFRDDFIKSVLFFVTCALGLAWAHTLFERTIYEERVLDFWPFVGVLSIAFVNHVIASLAAYLRSFKREPLVWISVAGAVLAIPLIVWAGRFHAVEQVVQAVLAVQGGVALPLSIWLWGKHSRNWDQVH